jgi:hypothetical protein
MRAAAVVLVLCALVRASDAGEARGGSETLVGWTDDGTTYAVTGFTTAGSEFFLEVRTDGKVVYRYRQPDEPDSLSPDKIDVEAWEPVKKFALKRITADARTKFKADLVAVSTTRAIDRYHCKAGGWTLKRKGQSKVLFEAKAAKDHCFSVLGGYVTAGGTHALVKIKEAWQLPQSKNIVGKVTEDHDAFVLVALR